MARDWENTEEVRINILDRMALHGENIAIVPFCETLTLDDEGEYLWLVDLHVKVARKTEFDVTGEGPTLSEALRRAYLRLSHEPVRN